MGAPGGGGGWTQTSAGGGGRAPIVTPLLLYMVLYSENPLTPIMLLCISSLATTLIYLHVLTQTAFATEYKQQSTLRLEHAKIRAR